VQSIHSDAGLIVRDEAFCFVGALVSKKPMSLRAGLSPGGRDVIPLVGSKVFG
jgi:hypothetical protein